MRHTQKYKFNSVADVYMNEEAGRLYLKSWHDRTTSSILVVLSYTKTDPPGNLRRVSRTLEVNL